MICWGILGAGKVAHRFAWSALQEPDSQLIAVAGRSQAKAETFAALHNIPRCYKTYEELLADRQIDAVYLALPHGCHKEWAIKALEAGKAVLCEKPAALTAVEMREIAQTARNSGRFFMEAMKPRFVPLYAEIKRLLADGYIGSLVKVETSLCNELPAQRPGTTYHTQPGQGGALLDVGSYCASWLAELLPELPTLEQLGANRVDGIDYYMDARLTAGPVSARLECAFDRSKPRRAVIYGAEGYMVIEELHRPQCAAVYRKGKPPQRIEMPYEADDFYGEIHHFVQCVEQKLPESPLMPLEASVRCAQILDIVREGLHYSPRCLEVLQCQEDILQYGSFGSKEALQLGAIAAELAVEYDRGVGIAIIRESDGLVIFQYMMDDKAPRNLNFMEGKRRAVLESGHSSLWPYVENAINGKWQDMMERKPYVLPSGGAFPIRANGEHVATISISGLHEGKDHELVVRALSKALEQSVPAFPCAAI